MLRSRKLLLRLGALLAAAQLCDAAYTLVDNYDTTNFFTSFDFYSGQDPTNGFVQYQTGAAAATQLLAGYADQQVYLGVDYHTQNPTAGRASVRLTSKKAYTKGLFVADITHMPVGCGVWPAFWMFGPSWPSSGEIDIIEGVNSDQTNSVTLHTSSGCTMSSSSSVLPSTSKLSNTGNCNAGNGNLGCGASTTDTSNYGIGFNNNDGGVYAMEWTSESIMVWFFPRGSPGANTLSTNGTAAASSVPDTSTWGAPLATFVGGSGCDIDSHFQNHNIVFNIDLCGDWAGQVFSQDATCSKLAASCNAFVQSNPQAFADAYWQIRSVKVYEQAGGGAAAAKRDDRVARPYVA